MKKPFILLFTLLGFLSLISLFLDLRIYQDRTLLVGDSLYYTDPTFMHFGGSFFKTHPGNSLMDVDNNLQNYPFRLFTSKSLARGEIPWWNPYVGMGIPFVGFGSGVFDPVAAVAGVLAPAVKAPNIIAVLGLWIAACGMFLFLGALGLSLPARIFGAVTFTFSGWTIVWLGRQNFMAEIWMPWIFWAAERLIQRRNAARTGLLALCAALVCLSGHLQTSFHIFTALSVYVLYRVFSEKRATAVRIGSLISFSLGVALGIGIALVQIIPLADLLSQYPLSRGRGPKTDDLLTAIRFGIRGNLKIMSHTIPTALTAISPLFFGSPQHLNYWWPARNFAETIMYLGLLPLFFALYGFTKAKALRGIRVWLVLAVLSVGVAYALPFFNLVNYLPVFSSVSNGRMRLIYRFAVIIAAAIGFEYYTLGSGPRLDRAKQLLAGVYAAAVLLLPCVVLLAHSLSSSVRSFTPVDTETLWSVAKSAQMPILVILAVFAVLLLVWKLRLIGNTAFQTMVVLITFADAFWILHDFNPAIPSSFVFPKTDAVKFFKKDTSLYRVYSPFLKAMPPNTKLPYDIYDVDLFSVLTVDRYADVQSLFAAPYSKKVLRNFRFPMPALRRGLINLMNIKYVMVTAGKGNSFGSLDQYRLVYNREVLIYENMEVLPRAFLVNRATVFNKPGDILDLLNDVEFDPIKAILLETPMSPALPEPVEGPPGGSAEITSITSNHVVVHATTQTPAYLVLSEVNYPGWKATVDGVETTIYPAYYLFRSVYLESGTHEIVFTFMPKSYAVAWKVSVGCLVMTFVLLLTGFKRRSESR